MVRIGLVGLGYWGPNYARVVTELAETELVAACDISTDATRLIQVRYPSIRIARHPSEILGADDIDAVVIATPTSTHFALARETLSAGKHVLCEKPLAQTTAECDDLITAADRVGRVLFVGHTFIYNPAVREMRRRIASGETGRVLYCHTARTALGPVRQDVNALWDLAPHDLSILLYLLERQPVWVNAMGQAFLREGCEDVVFLQLRFSDGLIAAAHLSWLDPYKVRRVTVVGDERMLVFDDIAVDEKLKVFDRGVSYETVSEAARGAEFGDFKALIRDGDIVAPKMQAAEPLKEQVARFAECCIQGTSPETDGAAGRRVVAVLEAATQSLSGGGVPVRVAPDPVADAATLPLVDLARQHRALRAELHSTLGDVLDSGSYILGDEVDAFEEEFAAYCETSECVGVASGTAAVQLALEAVGVGRGDEVIAPANTFIASVAPVVRLGARPVLVDCDPTTATLDIEQAMAALGPRTKAVLAVHLYGHPADVGPLREACDERGVALVEDACQAHGARYVGRRVGGLAHIAAFSFYPGKNLGALGDAGAVTTNNPDLADRIRLLRDLGQRRKYEHVVAGANERLDELQAAVLRVKLRALDRWNELRRAHAAAYSELLSGHDVTVPEEAPWAEHVWHLYVIRVSDRDRLREELLQEGIGVGLHYPVPLHLQEALAGLGHGPGDFPATEAWARELLSLPLFPELKAEEIERVVGRLLATVSQTRAPLGRTLGG